MIDEDAALGHHLLDVPQAQRIGRVPTHADQHHVQREGHPLDHLALSHDHHHHTVVSLYSGHQHRLIATEPRQALSNGIHAPANYDPVTDAARFARELVQVELRSVAAAYEENRLTDEARRCIERELDLAEARIIDRETNLTGSFLDSASEQQLPSVYEADTVRARLVHAN